MNDSQHKLVPFLHLPLQSGSDQILQNMKRRYQSREFIQEIQQAVDQVEGICIGTDVMVGFQEKPSANLMKPENCWKNTLSIISMFSLFLPDQEHLHIKWRIR